MLTDLVESVFGAVFLDSGMRMCAVEAVFKRMFWPTVGTRLAHHQQHRSQKGASGGREAAGAWLSVLEEGADEQGAG